jgi:hypothetical protein
LIGWQLQFSKKIEFTHIMTWGLKIEEVKVELPGILHWTDLLQRIIELPKNIAASSSPQFCASVGVLSLRI